MIKKCRSISAIVYLLCCWASASLHAASIDPNSAEAVLDSRGLSADNDYSLAVHLFDFSPFSASSQNVIPGFADPLGTGVDPGLRIFSGKVHFMDLLGNFAVAKREATQEIELPKNALQGINLLDNFLALYLSYDGRAYDTTQLNLHKNEVIERNGLPVTTETSPLSLAGFGSVSANLRPVSMHWTRCPGKEKRLEKMRQYIKQTGGPCPTPTVCQCFVL